MFSITITSVHIRMILYHRMPKERSNRRITLTTSQFIQACGSYNLRYLRIGMLSFQIIHSHR